MSGRGPRRLLLWTAALVAVAAVVLSVAPRPDPARVRREREFQRLVGGLGLGPSLDLARGISRFDPRLGRGAAPIPLP